MRIFLLFLALATQAAVAGMDRLSIQALNLDYKKPYGKGDVEKVNFGYSSREQFKSGPYPVEIHRMEASMGVNSHIAGLEWLDPLSFVHDMEELTLAKGNLSIGKVLHTLSLDSVVFVPKEMNAFTLKGLVLVCQGISTEARIKDRLMDDCRDGLHLTVDTLDVPLDFFIAKLVQNLPKQEPMRVDQRPADSLVLTTVKGDFALQVYTKLVFYAGLRAWGNLAYEKDRKVIAIRIDQVKFGYLSITSIVMRELRKRLKDPNVTITGNTIRIKI